MIANANAFHVCKVLVAIVLASHANAEGLSAKITSHQIKRKKIIQ